MGKKTLKLPSLFRAKEAPPSRKHAWRFLPSCVQHRTLSFRGAGDADVIFKTVNSVFFDPNESTVETPPESWFTTSSESISFSTDSGHNRCFHDGESLEMLVHGMRSERLFLEPGNTSSILEKSNKADGGFPFKESVVQSMESQDPYGDFKRSMEEMVETHGVKDWKGLEELLSWYLRVNGQNNHGFIVLAFVDLLISLASASDSSSHSASSYSSAVSSFASSPLYPSEGQNEIIEQHEDTVSS